LNSVDGNHDGILVGIIRLFFGRTEKKKKTNCVQFEVFFFVIDVVDFRRTFREWSESAACVLKPNSESIQQSRKRKKKSEPNRQKKKKKKKLAAQVAKSTKCQCQDWC
jgi:hypothetical protein